MKFMLIKSFFGGVVFLSNLVMANALVEQEDIYSANAEGTSLTVTWSGGSKTIEGVVGSVGETTRALVEFDGGKALRYENLASRSLFETYFTLIRRGDEIFIDCIYANVRNEQNGILINKAVCGLDLLLAEGYEDAAYEFTDKWKASTAGISIESLSKQPPQSLEVNESQVAEVNLVRVYETQDSLSYLMPRALLRKEGVDRSLGTDLVFSVYQIGNLDSPSYWAVSLKDIKNKFYRYDPSVVDELRK